MSLLLEQALDALRVLRQEHALILRRLLFMEEKAKGLQTAEEEKRQKLIELFLDECKLAWLEIFHHIKNEEEALFPTLQDQLDDREGLIQTMRCEHGEILAGMISVLEETVRGAGRSAANLDDDFVGRMQKFRSLVSEHFSREDRVLFWLADLHLPPSVRKKVNLELAEVAATGSSRLP